MQKNFWPVQSLVYINRLTFLFFFTDRGLSITLAVFVVLFLCLLSLSFSQSLRVRWLFLFLLHMAPALLTAVPSAGHVHLIIGANPLAGARCTRSLEVGAKPVVIAEENGSGNYSLLKQIETGEIQWLQRSFRDEDLTTLGREEVDGVVDAVFVTAGGKLPLGMYLYFL